MKDRNGKENQEEMKGRGRRKVNQSKGKKGKRKGK